MIIFSGDELTPVCNGVSIHTTNEPTPQYTIYSGYPDNKNEEQYTIPRYKQHYTWMEDYPQIKLDLNNCLRVSGQSRKCSLDLPRRTFSFLGDLN